MLRHVLPCPRCRREFSKETRGLSLRTFKNRATLAKWLVKVHNAVNARIGKRKVPFTMVRRRYIGYRAL